MNWYTRLFGWFKLVSKNVWDFVRPLVLQLVKVEAAGYIQLVTRLVVQAENIYGAGKGHEKYEYVVGGLKTQLGERFDATPYRVFDYLIHTAVAQLDER